MSGVASFLLLSLRAQRRRLIGLVAFGLLFLAAAATARVFTHSDHGHIEMDRLFELGGTTLVSALLLLGWLIGRFPLIAVLVLCAGIFSTTAPRDTRGSTPCGRARCRCCTARASCCYALLAFAAQCAAAARLRPARPRRVGRTRHLRRDRRRRSSSSAH
jgi:hypothetical protein